MPGEEISACPLWVCVFFRRAWRGTLLAVIEDLANEVGLGDVLDDAELASAERALPDVDVV